MIQALRRGLRPGSSVVDVDKAKVSAAAEVGIISRELLPPRKNDSDEFTIRPHPFLFVEADKAWCSSINCVVFAHLYLRKGGGLLGDKNE